MTTATIAETEIETGDEMTFGFEAQVDNWEDGELTGTAQRITEDGFCGTHVYLEDNEGNEIMYLVPVDRYEDDAVAQLRQAGGNVVLATVKTFEVA